MGDDDRKEIAEILRRRSNEIAAFHRGYTTDESHFGSVEMALTREMKRLRGLADAIYPEEEPDE